MAPLSEKSAGGGMVIEQKSERQPIKEPDPEKEYPEVFTAAARLYWRSGFDIVGNWAIWIVSTTTFLTGLLSILQVLFIRFRESPRLLP